VPWPFRWRSSPWGTPGQHRDRPALVGETVTSAPWAIVVEVITVLVMVTGVVLLAHRSESASAPTGDQHQHNEPSRT
jgi:hypothetical protein